MAATLAPVPETKGEGLSGQDSEQRLSSMDEISNMDLYFPLPNRTAATLPCEPLLKCPQTCLHPSGGFSWYKSVELAQAVTAVMVASHCGIVPSPPSDLHLWGLMWALECFLGPNKLGDLDRCLPLSVSSLV